MPIVEKIGVDVEDYDKISNEFSSPNSAPIMLLFFDNDGNYQAANIAGDDRVLHLEVADVVKAIVMYIGVYFAFHIGYAPLHASFLCFLQECYLNVPAVGVRKSSCLSSFLQSFLDKEAKFKELKQFKKHSVHV